MIILCIIAYLFVGVCVFRVLEKKHIGFDDYWYPAKEGQFKSVYEDKTPIWAMGGILLSIIWPLSVLFAIFYTGSSWVIRNLGIRDK